MTADDITASPEPVEQTAPHAAGTLQVGDMKASFSAIGAAEAAALSATGSAIGSASVGGDADMTASAVGIVTAKGSASFHQAYASAFIAGGDTTISQAASPVIIGKSVSMEQGVGAVVITGDADFKRSWVGVLLAPRASVSEDSKVLIDAKAALIIAAVLLGGFGLVAVAIYFGARRVSQWRPSIALPQLPSLAEIRERIRQVA